MPSPGGRCDRPERGRRKAPVNVGAATARAWSVVDVELLVVVPVVGRVPVPVVQVVQVFVVRDGAMTAAGAVDVVVFGVVVRPVRRVVHRSGSPFLRAIDERRTRGKRPSRFAVERRAADRTGDNDGRSSTTTLAVSGGPTRPEEWGRL